jgi:NAD(P)-dependent dehydrogenase (short-subunit alcohol dehydrogenase family)
MKPGDVWMVTGASSGIGLELCRTVLQRGGQVAAAARTLQVLDGLVEEFGGAILPVAMDVTSPEDIDAGVTRILEYFGKIDAVVNNAGYGYVSAIEEADEAEIRRLFDVNFFGLAAVTRRVLPAMREKRSGVIVNMSSCAGVVGLAGMGYYCASKFAVEGFSEALQQEVEPLGLHVLLVEPGPVRTEFSGRSLRVSPTTIEDYAPSAGIGRTAVIEAHGVQSADPCRVASAIVDLSAARPMPMRLPLGEFVLESGRGKWGALTRDYDHLESVARSVFFE